MVVRRISEQLQEDQGLLRSLADQGVRPGSTVRAVLANGSVSIGGTVLPPGVAQHVFVSPAEEPVPAH